MRCVCLHAVKNPQDVIARCVCEMLRSESDVMLNSSGKPSDVNELFFLRCPMLQVKNVCMTQDHMRCLGTRPDMKEG